MRIGLQTWGTDGDFLPFLALAEGFKKAGHLVTLAYTSIDGKDYTNHPNASGIKLIKADGGTSPNKVNPYAINASPGSFSEYTQLLREFYDPYTEPMYTASQTLCLENDLVIGHAVCHTLLTASQKYKCPRVSLVLTPIVVKSKHSSPTSFNLGTTVNELLWNMGGKISTSRWFKPANMHRAAVGLPPIKSLQKELFTSGLLTLVASSPSLTPSQPDWPKTVQTCGFLNFEKQDSITSIPSKLSSFLDEGEPPVYMTFGSCLQYNLKASTQLLYETAKKLNKRVVIQSDYPIEKTETNQNIIQVSNVAHSLVFPKCALIVHHGGAGTTQAALLAGKPSLIVPHGFDQMYWAKHLNEIGVSSSPIERKKANSTVLAQKLEALLSDTFAIRKAQEIGTKMSQENGVSKAVKIISNLNLK